jgi:hypothetical protein
MAFLLAFILKYCYSGGRFCYLGRKKSAFGFFFESLLFKHKKKPFIKFDKKNKK